MNSPLKHILIVAGVMCLAVFARCANKMTPQGGPKDTLPPRVKLATPAPGSRNFAEKRIVIEFDEYVQLQNQAKEFFTSPFMKIKPTLNIRDKSIRIDIKDTLAPNTTYALNFGAMVKDNNEGNVMYGMRYVFSTGPALDSMIMTGYASDAARGDSVGKAFVFFYDARRDSISYNDSLVYRFRPECDSLLFVARPDVVGRAENNGIFIAQNLKDIDYRIYAVQDNNGNERYDPGVDKVGFLDRTFNPADTTNVPFAIWLDRYRGYPTADPQVYFRMFGETPKRRQNLAGSERPGQHEAVLRFSAPFPQIDTLVFDSIPEDKILREYLTVGRDTLRLWFDVPPAMLPDTIKGRISYLKTDSIGNLVPTTQPLRLAWRLIETREEEREREKQEREKKRAEETGEEYIPPVVPNPFAFKVDAGGEVMPTKHIPIDFGLPLARIDSTLISLTAGKKEDKESKPKPFHLMRDTSDLRRWIIYSDWDEALDYNLVIPAGVFVNLSGQSNDTLKASFKIAKREKFATVNLNVRGKTPEANYIIEILPATGTTSMREIRNARSGLYTLDYIPEGEIRFRITEDGNANGKWDTGNLVEHREAERVEFYTSHAGNAIVPTRSNWEVDVTMDMSRIFAPPSIQKVRLDLQRAEDARVMKFMEEQGKKAEEERRRGFSGGEGTTGGGGLGIGSAVGGMRQQIQSTVR